MVSDTFIQNSLLHFPPEESAPGTSTLPQGALVYSLPDQNLLKPPSYDHDALGEIKSTWVLVLVPCSHFLRCCQETHMYTRHISTFPF